MLYEFYMLEQYYEAPNRVQFYEALTKKYGVEPLKKAVRAGHLIQWKILCGPDCGRVAFWLSAKGRTIIKKDMVNI